MIFSFLTLVRIYFRIQSNALQDWLYLKKEGLNLVLVRWVLGIPLLIATGLYIFQQQRGAWMYVNLPYWVRMLGIGLGYAAVGIIFLAHKALGRNFSSTLIIRREHRLVTSGPYRYVRHPMYSGYLLLFIAAFFVSRNWLLGGCGVGVIASLMTLRLVREEALLLQRFGPAYEEYRSKTGMFIPLTHKLLSKARDVRDLA